MRSVAFGACSQTTPAHAFRLADRRLGRESPSRPGGPLEDGSGLGGRRREELRQAILLAKASGDTYNDIGKAAGVTAQRVQQIVKDAQ